MLRLCIKRSVFPFIHIEQRIEFRKAGCLFRKLMFLLKRLFNFRFSVIHLLFQRSQSLFTGGKAGGERFKHIFHALNVAVNIAAEFHGVG